MDRLNLVSFFQRVVDVDFPTTRSSSHGRADQAEPQEDD
jgi:hypothetical protein